MARKIYSVPEAANVMGDFFARMGEPDRPALYSAGGEGPGSAFVRSEAYKRWVAAHPSGGPAGPGEYRTDPVQVQGGMRALITSADASAGTLVRPDFAGLLEPGLVRPLRVRELVTILPTGSDLVEFIREASRVSAAAPVGEATGINTGALTDATGRKPEGGLSFAVQQAIVRTIALWVPATKRVVADAVGLRQYIEQYLTEDVGLELEDQMIAGNGTGENFTGILNTPGIIAAGAPAAGENILDVIRRAIRRVQLEGRTNPSAVLLHPSDAEQADVLKATGSGEYFGAGPFGSFGQRMLWGVPVVVTDALPENTGLVGDFRRAILFDREQSSISIGTANDDFIKNVVRILCEMRGAFAVTRPTAFATVTL